MPVQAKNEAGYTCPPSASTSSSLARQLYSSLNARPSVPQVVGLEHYHEIWIMCVPMHSRILHIACQYLPIPSRAAMLFFAVMSILWCPLHCAAALCKYICMRNLRAYFTITIPLMSVRFQRGSNVFEGWMCFFLIQCCKEVGSNVEILLFH